MLKRLPGLVTRLTSLLPALLLVLGVSLALDPTPAALAQQDFAKIEGVVKDQTGAVIPGATVTIRSDALNIERKATTSGEGFYSIPQLRPSAYTMTVEANNFGKVEVKELVLGVGQTRSLDVELKAGNVVGEAVNIVASDSPATIDTSSNRLGVNVTEREVKELPVNGRNFSQLQLLTPGATNTGTGNFNEVRFNSRSNEQNQTRLDGIESTAIWDASPGYLTVQGSQFRLQTSLENIQEFRVDSSNYPAEYGTGTGGQINVIGKSGSNNFHGAVFEYLRNDALDARNFFDGSDKSKLRLNQFGGSLGGPLVKDRVFFFGSYEGLRQRAGFNSIELTPSNFSRDFINFFGTADPRGEAARAALGILPADANAALTRIQALRTLGAINAFPIGAGAPVTLGNVNQSAQFVQTNRVATLNEDAFSVRLDGKFNDRFNGYIRYQRDDGDLASPDGTSGRFIVASQQPDNFVAAVTQLYGGSVVNETKFGINRAPTTLDTAFSVSGSQIDFVRTAISLSGTIVQSGVNGGAPTGIVSPGGLTRQSSAASGRAQPIDPISYSFIDNLSWTKGNHSFKFGGEIRKINVDFDQLGGFTFTYGTLRDFLLNQNLTAAFVGDLSTPGPFSIASNPVTTFQRPDQGFHQGQQYYLIGYAQDEWKIKPNFTMSYGLRYEYYSTNREKNDRAILFDAATGQLQPPGTDFYDASKTGLGPRLAFSWAPARFNNKTVIRLGGGLYYGPGQYEDLIQPIESNVLRSTGAAPAGPNTAAGSLGPDTAQLVANPTRPITGFTPRAYDINGYSVPERITQYGLSIQQELPGNTVFTIAYVGSQGRNLFLRNVTNRILPGATTILSTAALPAGVGVINRVDPVTGRVVGVVTVREFDIINFTQSATTGLPTPANGSRLNPFGEIDFKTSGGRDNFNALQLTINRRFTKGLTLGGHYQWGHSLGNTQGSNEAQTTQDPFNFNGDYGNNTFDIRQSVNITALYELPFGKGRAYDLSGASDFILGGWMLGGVFNARSGLPMDLRITRADVVIQCTNPAAGCAAGQVLALPGTINAATPLPAGFTAVVNTPGGGASRATRRPDILPGVDPFLSLDGGNLRLLNPAAFAIPQPGTYGNLSRNALFGPSFYQFDMTLQKRFRVTEAVAFEFRTEFYNLFNRANFANPPVTLSNAPIASLQPGQPIPVGSAGNFGIINGTVGRTVGLGTNRQIQFSGRISF
jgi:Carboxypeptidase regulatory-like domain/TonB dependent receptor